MLRIQKETFNRLVHDLRSYGSLKDGRKVLVIEQVAIFLWIFNYSVSVEYVKIMRLVSGLEVFNWLHN